MREGNKGGALSPQAQSLKEQASTYVVRMLQTSGSGSHIPSRHIDTAIGHYLFEKARLQAITAEQLVHAGQKERALRLRKSALTHAALSLNLTSSVVGQALGTITHEDTQYPFHRARLFGIRLAQEELKARGGYRQRMTPEIEAIIAIRLKRNAAGRREAA